MVARDTTVCVYDRAGRGWSDATDSPQDGAHIASDLHTLLDRADVLGPYVLAGHSFGGLYVQSFAAQFPDQVAGMVLLDSTAPKPGPAAPTDTQSSQAVGRLAELVSAVAHLGVGRAIAQFSGGTLPPRTLDEADANASTARSIASSIKEYLAEANTSMQQASALTTLGSKPLIVVTADEANLTLNGNPSKTAWPRCPPTVCTVTPTPPTNHCSPTRPTPPQSARQSATLSPPYVLRPLT